MINAIDLFCGCGGMTKGLKDSGICVKFGIDIWDIAINSYNSNFPNEGYCEDLTTLEPYEADDDSTINLIVGGPPCQGFSIAGRRDEEDPRNRLFMSFYKFIDYFKPDMFVMENVIGILSMKTSDSKLVIDEILSMFSQNYNCCVNKLYASDFEVPQNRRRVIIVGVKKSYNIRPSPINIISDIHIPVSVCLIPKQEVDNKLYLTKRAIEGIKNKREKSKQQGNGFGAQFLDLDKPSYTIPARYWKDGYDALVKYNEKEIRRLDIIELKRIQTFPDDYKICGNRKEIIMQIGNAVPCKLAYHIGNYLIKLYQKFYTK